MNSAKKILVAEDEVHIAMAIKTILKKAFPGIVIDHAKNGAEAWEKAQSGGYQAILSDWNMPKKNGDEFLADVRGNSALANIPFLMLTARGDRDSFSEAVNAGVTDYVVKPFKPTELIAKLKTVLAKDQTKQEALPCANASPTELVVERFKQGFDRLPMLPEVMAKLNDLFNRDDVRVEEIAQVIELDASVAMQLISVANSPLLRTSSDCLTVNAAIARLGFEMTQNYVMSLACKGMFVSTNTVLNEVMEDLWWHSLATAYCSKLLARAVPGAKPEKLFLLGLLHDIGKLLLVAIVDDLSKTHDCFDAAAVKTVMERMHPDFGSALLKRWEYSEEFQNIAHFHHVPFNSEDISSELLIIYLANLMVRKIGFGNDEEELENVASSQAAIKLGLNNEVIAAVLDETNQSLAAVKGIF